MREWLVSELTRLGARVERQTFTDSLSAGVFEFENVVAGYGPANAPRMLLLAHFDSRPWADQEASLALRQQPVPGANDGGSGVAVLLEMAELMHRRAPAVRVDLVFLDGEDLGRPDRPEEYCRGSRHHAASLPAPGSPDRPRAAFLFDMVGDRDLEIMDEGNSVARASNLVELVHQAAAATGASHVRPGVRYTLIDDHVPYLEQGIPAVDLIDFDYPAWHTVRDLPDQLSAESLGEVSRLAAWLVYRSPLARP